MRRDGATPIYIGIDGKAAGIFAIADPVKATAQQALKALHADGIRIVILTGDNRTTAKSVARRLNIVEVEADVLPDQKSGVVARVKSEAAWWRWAETASTTRWRSRPPMSASPRDLARTSPFSAGTTLLKGDLMGIVKARRLSEATMRNIRQNLIFAFIYNAAGAPIAVVGPAVPAPLGAFAGRGLTLKTARRMCNAIFTR